MLWSRGGQPASEQEPHFVLCYHKQPHHTHAHHPASSSPKYLCSGRFIVNITHQHDNDRNLQSRANAPACACACANHKTRFHATWQLTRVSRKYTRVCRCLHKLQTHCHAMRVQVAPWLSRWAIGKNFCDLYTNKCGIYARTALKTGQRAACDWLAIWACQKFSNFSNSQTESHVAVSTRILVTIKGQFSGQTLVMLQCDCRLQFNKAYFTHLVTCLLQPAFPLNQWLSSFWCQQFDVLRRES